MSAIAGGATAPARAGASAPARPDAVRRHNLTRLLAEVHRDGELSRADLTARLGLNRSTIGTLVVELVNLGLIEGSAPDVADRSDLSAGRPSHVVRPRCDGPFVLAVDIEVDRVAVAAVGIGGRVLHREDRATRSRRPASVANTVARSVERVATVADGWPVGIGVSVPGSVERRTGRVALAPNLDWRDVEFAALLRDALARTTPAHGALLRSPLGDLPVQVGNDANLGAVAEQARGRARGHDDVVFLLGRIGVGAGIIADSQLLTGWAGAAGEIGHLCLSESGPPCHCGSRGCAEVYIGDAALLAAAGRPAVPDRDAVEAVLAAAAAGSAPELRGVREVAGHLGRTIAALLNLVNPSVVVAGGTLARVVEIAGDHTHDELARYAFGRAGEQVELHAAASPAGDACLLGAAEMAFGPVLADPAAFGEVTVAASR